MREHGCFIFKAKCNLDGLPTRMVDKQIYNSKATISSLDLAIISVGCFLACNMLQDSMDDNSESYLLFRNTQSLSLGREVNGFVIGEVQITVSSQFSVH